MSKKKRIISTIIGWPWSACMFLAGCLVYVVGYAYGVFLALKDTVSETFTNASSRGRGISAEERAKRDADEACKAATRASYAASLQAQKSDAKLSQFGVADVTKATAKEVTTALICLQATTLQNDERMSATGSIGVMMQAVQESGSEDFIRIIRRTFPTPEGLRVEISTFVMRWGAKNNLEVVGACSGFTYLSDSPAGERWSANNVYLEYECFQGQYGNACSRDVVSEYATTRESVLKSFGDSYKYTVDVFDLGLPCTNRLVRNIFGMTFYASDKMISIDNLPRPNIAFGAAFVRQDSPVK